MEDVRASLTTYYCSTKGNAVCNVKCVVCIVQCSAVQCSSVQFSAAQCSAVQIWVGISSQVGRCANLIVHQLARNVMQCSVQGTVCRVQCAGYSVQGTVNVFTVYCIMYSALGGICSVRLKVMCNNVLHSVQCNMYTIYFKLTV